MANKSPRLGKVLLQQMGHFTRALLMGLLLGFALSNPALSTEALSCGAPPAATAEWPTSSPADAGLDAALLCSIDETLDKSPEMNVHAVVVVRHGALVYETYRSGEDNSWGKELGTVSYTAKMPHDLRSISKSVVSLLIGIAVDRKLIAGVDEPVFSFFPDFAALRTPQKERIRLRDLLTMRSGLAWDERLSYDDPRNSERKMIRSVNPYRYVLEQPAQDDPGAKWNYSGGDTQLLGGVLQRTTGKFLAEFAKEALLEPLGISEFEWLKMPANGEMAADSGLRLRPRDMAKIGKLVLDKGMWNGRRVVSQAWIDQSTRTHVANIDDTFDSIGYGYQWWTDHEKLGDREISWISAQGLGGQRIYIIPSFDLVVVITAGLYNDKSQGEASFNILDKFVLAAIRR
jgi:CubicO group peptidase (beta-lactamase class C family)